MIEKEKITLAARIGALELIVARVVALQTIEFSDDQFDEVTRSWASSADALTSGKILPVESNLWVAALDDALQELLQLSRERRHRCAKNPPISDDLPSYAKLLTDLAARGVGSREIADRLGIKIKRLTRLRQFDRVDDTDETYRRLLRLWRTTRLYGSASVSEAGNPTQTPGDRDAKGQAPG